MGAADYDVKSPYRKGFDLFLGFVMARIGYILFRYGIEYAGRWHWGLVIQCVYKSG